MKMTFFAPAVAVLGCLLLTIDCEPFRSKEFKFGPPKSSYRQEEGVVSGSGEPLKANVTIITPAFFGTPLPPSMGRTFLPEEYVSGGRVAMLNGSFWKIRFAADPNIIGKTIQINNNGYTVVGVMPETFDFPARTDIWVPAQDLN
jgi:hypothetical protein